MRSRFTHSLGLFLPLPTTTTTATAPTKTMTTASRIPASSRTRDSKMEKTASNASSRKLAKKLERWPPEEAYSRGPRERAETSTRGAKETVRIPEERGSESTRRADEDAAAGSSELTPQVSNIETTGEPDRRASAGTLVEARKRGVLFSVTHSVAALFAVGRLHAEVKSQEPPRKPKVGPQIVELKPTGHRCIACHFSNIGSEIRAPCGHFYDIECAVRLFEISTRDEALYPPKCCRIDIPLSSVRTHLDPAVLRAFKTKASEVKVKRRVYCANPICGRFLCAEGSHSFLAHGHFATCTCGTTTCTQCKKRVGPERGARKAHVCEADARDAPILALGQRNGWARCPGCAQMVERNDGCNHMTCRCKTEFCYQCAELWEKCPCRRTLDGRPPRRGPLGNGMLREERPWAWEEEEREEREGYYGRIRETPGGLGRVNNVYEPRWDARPMHTYTPPRRHRNRRVPGVF